MKIVIIGAGNVGYHLATALHESQHEIVQIFSRSAARFSDLKHLQNTDFITDLTSLNTTADLYILAVSDTAIQIVSEQMPLLPHAIMTHTSGATSMQVLQRHKNYGIFYPLQTFTRHKKPNFSQIPFILDSNKKEWIEKLQLVASFLSENIYFLNDSQRQTLHLAAVFANNFTNHILHISNDICEKNNVDFHILHPLIAETFEKIKYHLPADIQTGPAKRHDEKTILAHLNLLSNQKIYSDVYELVSKSIQKTYIHNFSNQK